MTEQKHKRLKRYVKMRLEIIYNDGRKEVQIYDKVHRHNLFLIWLELMHLKNEGKIKDFEMYDDMEGGDIHTKRITDFLTSKND